MSPRSCDIGLMSCSLMSGGLMYSIKIKMCSLHQGVVFTMVVQMFPAGIFQIAQEILTKEG